MQQKVDIEQLVSPVDVRLTSPSSELLEQSNQTER